jgi:hypothetical protein
MQRAPAATAAPCRDFCQLGDALLEPLFPVARGIRLLGISMSSLAAEEAEQPEFSLPV